MLYVVVAGLEAARFHDGKQAASVRTDYLIVKNVLLVNFGLLYGRARTVTL